MKTTYDPSMCMRTFQILLQLTEFISRTLIYCIKEKQHHSIKCILWGSGQRVRNHERVRLESDRWPLLNPCLHCLWWRDELSYFPFNSLSWFTNEWWGQERIRQSCLCTWSRNAPSWGLSLLVWRLIRRHGGAPFLALYQYLAPFFSASPYEDKNEAFEYWFGPRFPWQQWKYWSILQLIGPKKCPQILEKYAAFMYVYFFPQKQKEAF